MEQESKSTILVLDKSEINVEILRGILNDFDIKSANAVSEALQLVEKEKNIHLILMDTSLQDFDGFQLCETFKKKSATSEIPVIMMIPAGNKNDKIKSFSYGASDVIHKPFEPEEVSNRVETFIKLFVQSKELNEINISLESKVRARTEALQDAKNKAEENSKLKSHFLALMSHELRTPLAGILGFAEILSDEIEDELLKDFALRIQDSGARLKDTLNSLLDLSRIEANKLEISIEEINLEETIREIINTYSIKASAKDLFLEYNNVNAPLFFNTDKTFFTLIFNNLLDNAVKYTDAGAVSVEIMKKKYTGEDVLKILVSDSGIGIPEEKLALIFEEFRQVDEGMGRNFEGVGLGLALTKKYIEKLGGSISVESIEGEGSTFTIRLPFLEKTAKTTPKVEIEKKEFIIPKTDYSKSLPKILLVEDDDTNTNLTKMFLQDEFHIDNAFTGEEALIMISDTQYDAILMDINLGTGMDGLKTTEEIRKKSSYQSIPIIAVTAYAMDGDREHFLTHGCTHYMSKPFRKKELTELLKGILYPGT